jgi:hypothetical protein
MSVCPDLSLLLTFSNFVDVNFFGSRVGGYIICCSHHPRICYSAVFVFMIF